MKIKQHLVITEPARFFAGDYRACFNLYDHENSVEEWLEAGEIEIEVPDELIQKAQSVAIAELEKVEKSIKEQYTKDIIRIETARQELLCITHQEAG